MISHLLFKRKIREIISILKRVVYTIVRIWLLVNFNFIIMFTLFYLMLLLFLFYLFLILFCTSQ